MPKFPSRRLVKEPRAFLVDVSIPAASVIKAGWGISASIAKAGSSKWFLCYLSFLELIAKETENIPLDVQITLQILRIE